MKSELAIQFGNICLIKALAARHYLSWITVLIMSWNSLHSSVWKGTRQCHSTYLPKYIFLLIIRLFRFEPRPNHWHSTILLTSSSCSVVYVLEAIATLRHIRWRQHQALSRLLDRLQISTVSQIYIACTVYLIYFAPLLLGSKYVFSLCPAGSQVWALPW